MSDKPEEESKRIHKQVAPRILDLADPARGDDANEFQGYHHDASVSFIVTSVFSPSNLELVDFLVSTDTTGAFVSNGWDFCLRDTDTSVEVTVTNSTGAASRRNPSSSVVVHSDRAGE